MDSTFVANVFSLFNQLLIYRKRGESNMCNCAEVKNQWIILEDKIEDGENEGQTHDTDSARRE